jgi:hypothetical protein
MTHNIADTSLERDWVGKLLMFPVAPVALLPQWSHSPGAPGAASPRNPFSEVPEHLGCPVQAHQPDFQVLLFLSSASALTLGPDLQPGPLHILT